MEHQSREQQQIMLANNCEYDAPTTTEGKQSKSKQMLKRCINEFGPSFREKGFGMSSKQSNYPLTNIAGAQGQMWGSTHQTKLIAPKPVRASRPIALTSHHSGNSKWLQTSPIKNEAEDTTSINSQNDLFSNQGEKRKEGLVKKINFQNEQNLIELKSGAALPQIEQENSKGLDNNKRTNKLSELESLLEAEQELSSIFNKTKESLNQETSSMNWHFNSAASSFDHAYSNASFSQQESSKNNSSYQQQQKHQNIKQTGFSRFNSIKVNPFISRPSCNPLLRDERFKQINTLRSEESFINLRKQNMEGSSIADQQNLFRQENEGKLINGVRQLNGVSQSQATSPTACSSNRNIFSFNHNTSGTTTSACNFSMLNGTTSNGLQQYAPQNPFCLTQPLNFSDNNFENQLYIPTNQSTHLASSAPELNYLFLPQQHFSAVDQMSYEYQNLYDPCFTVNQHQQLHLSAHQIYLQDEQPSAGFSLREKDDADYISSQEFTLHIEEDQYEQLGQENFSQSQQFIHMKTTTNSNSIQIPNDN